MAENKKSFVLYADLLSVVKKIVESDRLNNTNYGGELFLIILEYVNDLNPIPINFIVELAFEPIKQQLKRDLIKWSEFRLKQSDNGKKGGRPKKDIPFIENPENPSLNLESQKSLNVNVSVNDNVNDSVSVSNMHTHTGILGIDYILSYQDTSEEFKSMYKEEFYKSWLTINRYLNEECKYLRTWNDQITIAQYKMIYDKISKGEYSIQQAKQALSDLDGSKQAKEKYNSVYHGFNTYIKFILKNV